MQNKENALKDMQAKFTASKNLIGASTVDDSEFQCVLGGRPSHKNQPQENFLCDSDGDNVNIDDLENLDGIMYNTN